MCLLNADAAAQRFLLRFSYIGSRYNGLQRQRPRNCTGPDNSTIQGVLEAAMDRCLRLRLPVKIFPSSRTDRHVHADVNAAHVTLFSYPGHAVGAEMITKVVNSYLKRTNHDIVVRSAIQVPYWFNCRAEALCRTYEYRGNKKMS
ncbi:uncharacterized protein LOC114828493 [Galendromus occidentalis]|uniref:Uncharacterized protein LOC114828493 n=1 Tax=Galendromus occidentalis TaxID=34638 RepID=A0AAJ7SHC6_9ACAR|nr:uncharacterized protein LOC114828493 [Galendromus occidentalis]